jgi:hypothetical protein
MASRREAHEGRDDAQTVVARVLLHKIQQDKHPSITQMSLLEEMLPAAPSLRREYLNILLEKVMSTPTPSISMLRRIQQVSQQL